MKKSGSTVIVLCAVFLASSCCFHSGEHGENDWPLAWRRELRKPYGIEGTINADFHYFDGTYFYLGGDGEASDGVSVMKFDKNGNRLWKRDLKHLAEAAGKNSTAGMVMGITGVGDRLYVTCDQGMILGNRSELFCLGTADGSFIYKTDLNADLPGPDASELGARATPWEDYVILPAGDFQKTGEDFLIRIFVFSAGCTDGVPIVMREYEGALRQNDECMVADGKLFLLNYGTMMVLDLPKLVDPAVADEECLDRTLDEPDIRYGDSAHNIVLYGDTYINNEMVVNDTENHSYLICRRADNDSIVWRHRFTGPMYEKYWMTVGTSFVTHGDLLFAAGFYGQVACLDMRDGRLLWQTRACPKDEDMSNLWARGVVLHDRWYVQPSYSMGMVYVFDIETGRTLLAFELSHYFTSTAENCWESDGLFYFLACDGFSAIRFLEK